MKKKNRTAAILVSFLLMLTTISPASSLEQLSEDQMDSVSGQFGSVMMDPMMTTSLGIGPENFSGLSIITSPMLINHTGDSLQFTPSLGYLKFNTIEASLEINSIWHTTYNTGWNNPIKFSTVGIDEPDTLFTDTWPTGSQDYYIANPLNGKAVVTMNASEAILTFNFSTMDDVILNDKSIGKLHIDNLDISKIHTELLTIDGTPHMALQAAIEVGEINYNHDVENSIDPVNSFKITGLMAAEKFQVGGIDDILPSYLNTVSPGGEINSSLWESSGTIKMGNGTRTPVLSFMDDPLIEQGAPTASVDPYAFTSIAIHGDSEPYIRHRYTIRTDPGLDMNTIYEVDPDGYVGDGTTYPFVANPRLNKSYINARIALEGSIRARGIEGYVPLDTTTNSWGNASMGYVAVDGLKSIVNIEAPGYGYGNTWNSLPYDESKYQ
ncbi:MAG: hypothetical protein R6X10_09320 [Desulfobacterales bacterium]